MKISIIAAAVLSLAIASASAADLITGAGSTFAYPIYAKWASLYNHETGIGLNYQSIGSGGGIKQIEQRTVTFGATDMPLPAAELERVGLVQFPTVMGGVVPIVNLAGIKPGEITLSGQVLAKIYLGTILRGEDPAIRALNPKVHLPSAAIAPIHRSDGSGTTYIFTDYLSKVSPEWQSNVGTSTAVPWPGGIGAKGSEGVSALVAQINGSIGYVEYAYAKQNAMTYTLMLNHDGVAVAPTASAFQAAAGNADWTHTPGFAVMLTDQPGAQSWPIAGATFILMHKHPSDVAASLTALKYFSWAYEHGIGAAKELDYVPMPDPVIAAIRNEWKKIVDPSGHPLFVQ